MTLNELKSRLATEKHFTGSLWIICGEKIESPGILGIYEEDGCWNIYDTDDRGGICVLDHGSEEEMTDAFYQWVLETEEWALKSWTLKKEC